MKLTKKLLVLTVILSLALSIFSCGKANEEPLETQVTTELPETTESPTTEAETDPLTYTEDPLFAEIVQHMYEDDNYLIFVIGDSLTQGSGASDPVTLDYTAQFTKKLAEHMSSKTVYRVDGKPRGDYLGIQYPNTAMHVTVQEGTGDNGSIIVARCGIGGNTIKSIVARSKDFVGKEIRKQKGDLFIIMTGINDFYSSTYDITKYVAPPLYKTQFNTLIDMIYEKHPDADIILMTPTFVSKDGKGLDLYAKAIFQLASERNLPVIDQHKLWMDHWIEGSENYGQREWLNPPPDGDSCHPSDIGHEAIADEMIRALFGTKPD